MLHVNSFNVEKHQVDLLAFTRREFCEAYRIGHSKYFELKSDGLGPRELRIGKKILISREAADEWRRRMEELTDAQKPQPEGARDSA